jgi:predicted small secreted protein
MRTVIERIRKIFPFAIHFLKKAGYTRSKGVCILTKRVYLLLCLTVLSLPLVACNTIEGFGRDVRAVGDAITGHGTVRGY